MELSLEAELKASQQLIEELELALESSKVSGDARSHSQRHLQDKSSDLLLELRSALQSVSGVWPLVNLKYV